MHMHPSNGDTSNKEHNPQKENKTAIEIIKRLSVERFFGISHFINRPQNPPINKAARLKPIGLRMLTTLKLPEETATEMDIATL